MIKVSIPKPLTGIAVTKETPNYAYMSSRGHSDWARVVRHVEEGDPADDEECELRIKAIVAIPDILADYARLVWMLDAMIVNRVEDPIKQTEMLEALRIAQRQASLRDLGVDVNWHDVTLEDGA